MRRNLNGIQGYFESTVPNSLDLSFNRPSEVLESNKAGIHLSHGRASERYGSIPSMTSKSNFLQTIMQSGL